MATCPQSPWRRTGGASEPLSSIGDYAVKRFLVLSIAYFLVVGDTFAARSKDDYHFDEQGIQVGQTLPDLTTHLQSGESVRVSKYHAKRLTLIVCESLTCPVARRKHPGLKEIAGRFGDRIDVVVFYTIEAHPHGDPSPYTEGEEWVTQLNRKQGVLCRQPTTLDERLKLAKRLKEAVAIDSALLVDCMTNAGWRALGAGPNVALLVDPKGLVLAKQGWFDPKKMAGSIKRGLKTSDSTESHQGEKPRDERQVEPKCDCLSEFSEVDEHGETKG